MNRSTITDVEPKSCSPWRMAVSIAETRSSAVVQTVIPMPPPPATLLTITGKPISSAADAAAETSVSASLAGSSGTPAAIAASRARSFWPNHAIWAGVGPMNVQPASSTSAANDAFSDRKPYPGCSPVAPVFRAIATSCSASR